MLRINKITPPTATILYIDENGLEHEIGEVNEYEFNEFRIRIKTDQLDGYEVMTKQKNRSKIKPNGEVEKWPKDLFNLIDIQLDSLINWGSGKN